MSGHWSEPETHERPVERRLRGALAARAHSITPADLRPAEPPGPHLRRMPLARLRLRRFALPLAGLATAAAVVIGYASLTTHHDGQRPLPANSPGPVKPPPTPAPARTPRPADSAPPSDPAPSGEPPSVGGSRSSGRGPTAVPSKAPGSPTPRGPSRGAVPDRSTPPSPPAAR
ncbi:hypothetical protein ACGFW5_12130 [Streptomyces sp. NPDC048416]|uniref:hypothetical protein n=1 Tax=Streptomyces sp. NPDC048416 TaxID=3365546 RepID=UPI003710B249